MKLFEIMGKKLLCLNKYQLIKEVLFSKSQFYEWLKCVDERKKREPKLISEEVVCSAVKVIRKYPYFSGLKGQMYMIYHRQGHISQNMYKNLKRVVKRTIFQEVSSRKLLPAKTSYEHEIPDKPGEIWAEDFTQIKVSGIKFSVSLLIDVASNYYLGAEASVRPNTAFVESPVLQGLKQNNGIGPKRFLLSDNGSQYVSDKHGELLDKLDIVHKRIPSCTPEYNGSMECGVKESKNVFYNVLAEEKNKISDKEKNLLDLIKSVILISIFKLNHEIPRPCFQGVTPADIHFGKRDEKKKSNDQYIEQEKQRKEVSPWSKNIWDLVKSSLFETDMNNFELVTKFCFFLKRPLRKLSNLKLEVLGN